MANEKYLFLSCAISENTGFDENTASNGTNFIGANATETQTRINTCYKGTSLQGLVTGIGYGW